MNKLVLSIVAAAMTVLVGCKTTWTVEEAYKVGTSVGFTTAYVLNNQAKVDNATRDTIIKITTEVQKYVPGSNETFYVAWTPIVNAFVDNAVKNGQITEKTGTRVKNDFGYIITLLDSYVEKKGLKPYQDCINAFVDGFCTKFLANFKPANAVSVASITEKLDEDAYEYLSTKYTK